MSRRANNQIVYVVNRSTVPLDGMADGQPLVIRPGYKLVPVLDPATGKQAIDDRTKQPIVEAQGAMPDGRVLGEPLTMTAALLVRRQHPVMGTEDFESPGDAEFLIAIPSLGHDYSYMEQTDSPEVLDRASMLGPGEQAFLLTKKGRKAPKVGQTTLKRSAIVIPDLGNPNGIDTYGFAK